MTNFDSGLRKIAICHEPGGTILTTLGFYVDSGNISLSYGQPSSQMSELGGVYGGDGWGQCV